MTKDDNNDEEEFSLKPYLMELERTLGVRENFLFKLTKEDDWSFIIKLHALVESAVSHLLTETTHLSQCSGIFARLPLSEKKTGKLAFIKSMNLLEKHFRKFISTLSEVRNDLIHNVRNIEFDLKKYANALSPENKRNLVDAFFFGHKTAIEAIPNDASINDRILRAPKLMLWAQGTLLMGMISMKCHEAKNAREKQAYDNSRLAKLDEVLTEYLSKNVEGDKF